GEQMAEPAADKAEEEEVLVSSRRIDGCLSKLYKLSRAESLALFQSARVYVDGRLAENNSRLLKPGNVVNVRGYGKFIFTEIKYETKKGKLCLGMQVYR
ncbi:MAG: hypothetical protein K2I01_02395, partial [Lachnospiraceae bacterium]|nr:hypothetical protein [Lachnospiraceae bacterium]